MRHGVTSILALTLSLLLSPAGLVPAARGQQQRRVAFDTGVVTLGPGQFLRLTAAADEGDNTPLTLRFRRLSYGQGACGGGVCRLPPDDEDQLPAVTLPPGEAASMDVMPGPGSAGVRGEVISDRRDLRVTAQVVDAATGGVVAIWVPQGSPAVGTR